MSDLREKVAEALYRRAWPKKQIWLQALSRDREEFLSQSDAVMEALMEHGHALANEIRDEAWHHERDERENQLIYKLADKIDPYEESK